MARLVNWVKLRLKNYLTFQYKIINNLLFVAGYLLFYIVLNYESTLAENTTMSTLNLSDISIISLVDDEHYILMNLLVNGKLTDIRTNKLGLVQITELQGPDDIVYNN